MQIPSNQLKELLMKDGLVTEDSFDAAAIEAERLDQDIDDILISRGVITEKYLLGLLQNYFGVSIASLDPTSLNEEIVKVLPEDMARQRRVIVFGKNEDGSYNLAMENPSDLETVEFLSGYLKAPVHPFLTTAGDLQRCYSVYTRGFAKDFKQVIEDNIRASLQSRAKGVEEAAADIPIVELVNNVVSYAASLGASDIHIEPLENNILIRYRIDGILREIMRIPKQVHLALTARLKLLSALKLDEHTKPQDGRFRFKLVKEVLDVRVSILPTFHGEKTVLRLLPAAQKPMSLEELGIDKKLVPVITENISKTYGMIIVCGPTGSGKTTTLYSLMNILNRPEVNIVTIEDPVEYEIKYVNQTQINTKAGVTFAGGLRSILRQDPNIILVGEIRDQETADISVQAALTGHLLLSSLHTNDAPTAIPRLMDMNVAPFLVSAVLNVVIAQRLVRKICPACIYSYEPDGQSLTALKRQLSEIHPDAENINLPKVLYKGKGCNTCGGTGYKGRIGIFEILAIDDTVREAIVSPDVSLEKIQAIAKKQGMVTMFEDGLRKAQTGVTTLEEVMRVIRE